MGAAIGSFLNVVIYRLPRGEDIVFKRSHCPKCKTKIKWYNNIPLLSFLILRGKCSECRTKISWRYFLVELLVGISALYFYHHFVLRFGSYGDFVFYFVVFCLFVCHFFIDIDHQILPDSINIVLLVLLGGYAIFHFSLNHWLIGAAVGFLGPLTVTWLFYKLRGQIGLGGGDIKLYGILGFYLGPFDILRNIFLSCFVGTFVILVLMGLKRVSKDDPVAFGPSIIFISVWQIFFPEQLNHLMKLVGLSALVF